MELSIKSHFCNRSQIHVIKKSGDLILSPNFIQLEGTGGLWGCHGYDRSLHLWPDHYERHLQRPQQGRQLIVWKVKNKSMNQLTMCCKSAVCKETLGINFQAPAFIPLHQARNPSAWSMCSCLHLCLKRKPPRNTLHTLCLTVWKIP